MMVASVWGKQHWHVLTVPIDLDFVDSCQEANEVQTVWVARSQNSVARRDGKCTELVVRGFEAIWQPTCQHDPEGTLLIPTRIYSLS
jgi:hypothetical protein